MNDTEDVEDPVDSDGAWRVGAEPGASLLGAGPGQPGLGPAMGGVAFPAVSSACRVCGTGPDARLGSLGGRGGSGVSAIFTLGPADGASPSALIFLSV